MENNKKGSILKKVLIVISILIILVLIVAGYISIASKKAVDDFIKNDKQVLTTQVDQFISYVISSKTNDAYALTDQQHIPLAALGDPILRNSLLKYQKQDFNFHDFKVVKWLSGDVTVEYRTVIYFSDTTTGQMYVVAKKEKETWKIIGFGITTPPDKMW